MAVPICIYCRDAEGTQDEHVFPRSWYPDTTPATTQWLTVRSCPPCNARWRCVEEAFGHELILTINPTLPEVRGVPERLTRAWQLTKTVRNARDARSRAAQAREIAKTMVWVAPSPGAPQATIRTPAGLVIRASPARTISAVARTAIAEKFVRGFHWNETRRPAGEFEIQAVNLMNDERLHAQPWALTLGAAAALNDSLAPGLIYKRVHGRDTSFWAFRIWGQANLIAVTRPALAPPDHGPSQEPPS